MNQPFFILKDIIKVSRPRFWLYLAGPFLIGFLIGVENLSQFNSFSFWSLFFYFLIPANFILYGINDLADEKTDSLNNKKEEKEIRVSNKNRRIILILVLISFFLSSLLFFYLKNFNLLIFFLFIFLSIFYSLPPVRFKSIPFLDFISNFLYILPGLIGFYLVSLNPINILVLVSAIFWSFGMHLFSAIPDIEPDKLAQVKTTAVFLGERKSLIFCSLIWFISWIFLFSSGKLSFIVYLFLIYPFLPTLLFFSKKIKLIKIYWLFPYINNFLGFFLFIWILIDKIKNSFLG
jgi:4-hydroxybenzoate polyprenyltransferase